MKPDSTYAEFGTLSNDLYRDIRVGRDDYAIHRLAHGGKIRITSDALYLGRAWIDRKDLVSLVTKFPIDCVCRLPGLPGDTCNGDAFAF
jgi:hypothetical protein